MKKVYLLVALMLASLSVFAVNYFPEKSNMQPLKASQMKPNPMEQFEIWFKEEGRLTGGSEREASYFVLATVGKDCRPSTRTMMAKEIDLNGFSFAGDLQTRKFQELKSNSNAAATFNWSDDERQVNMTGMVEPLTDEEAEKIFREMEENHQITAMLFPDLQEVTTQEAYGKHHKATKEYQDKEVPLPSTWGGYRFIPDRFEFWQKGPNNLNSRVAYTKTKTGQWQKTQFFK